MSSFFLIFPIDFLFQKRIKFPSQLNKQQGAINRTAKTTPAKPCDRLFDVLSKLNQCNTLTSKQHQMNSLCGPEHRKISSAN